MNAKHKKANFFYKKGLFSGLGSFSELERRISGLPEEERGDAFEVFAEAYFNTQKIHQSKELWPDSEMPQMIRANLGLPSTDKGIDGVFKSNDGQYHAYQVKYRSNRLNLSWEDLSTFMGLSDKSDQRVLFTNSNDISSVMNARTDFYSIKGNDLDKLEPSDFKLIEDWFSSAAITREKKIPLPHQSEAINDILQEFKKNDRATAIMACGSGKTLVALWTAEKRDAQTILVLLPSLALVRQALHDWAKETSWDDFNYLCVCSDATVINGVDETVLYQRDLDFPVTTEKEVVQQFLNNNSARKIIFSTYQSSQIVAEAMSKNFAFDLAIFDEAHKTASRDGANYAFALQDTNLLIKKRLFLTATPRHYNVNKKDKEGEQRLVYSMDDEIVYGRISHQLSFRRAVEKDLICDYKVIVSVVTSEEVNRELLKCGEVVVEGDVIKAQRIANIIALENAVNKYGVKKIFSFHSSVNAAKSFTSNKKEGIGAYLKDFVSLHVNGEMSTSMRDNILKEFKESARAIISNARCLTEGVNVPAVNMVAFVSPKKSQVDIVQAAGRAMRKLPGKECGYILIPLFIQLAENENLEEALEKTKFQTVWDVLQAMQEQDESLVEIIAQMREDRGRALGFNDNRLREKVDVLGPEVCINELRASINTKVIDHLGVTWDERFGELIRFREEYGHCNVPQNYKNKHLSMWIGVQRKNYKNGRLIQKRINRLNKLEFIWDSFSSLWEKRFEELIEFKKKFNHCSVPESYDKKLHLWVGVQRREYKKESLCKIRLNHLERIGFKWDVIDDLWIETYLKYKFYKQNNKSLDSHLVNWQSSQRKKYKQSKLPQKYIDRLNELDFIWNPYEEVWEEKYQRLSRFCEKNGHCDVPPEDKELNTWLHNQRSDYKNKKLSLEQIKKLSKLNFEWNIIEKKWEHNVSSLCDFRKKYGHCNVPQAYKEDETLSHFVVSVRKRFKNNKLSQDKINRLNKIGFIWDMNQLEWENKFIALCVFKKEYGHCNVPKKYNSGLFYWVKNQRIDYRLQNMPKERLQKLNSIGFIGNYLEHKWQTKFDDLCKFKKEYGHCNVPVTSGELGSWVRTQRIAYLQSKLSQSRIDMLKNIDFIFRNKFEAIWEERFNELAGFHSKNGNCDVSKDYKNYSLFRWVGTQRNLYKKNQLKQERINRLNSLGFNWHA